MFHMFSNSINCEILTQFGMRFEKVSELIQITNDYMCWEQIWFDRANTLHAVISKS
jgi:hypothetical protein